MSDDLCRDPTPSGRRDGPPPAASPHLLPWWFGLMAIGGVGLGFYADERPFGRGVFAHPLTVFTAYVMRFLRPNETQTNPPAPFASCAFPLIWSIAGCIVTGGLLWMG